MIKEKDIVEAWVFLRKHNHSLPDEVLDFIKESSLKALEHLHPVQSEVMQIFTKPELDQRIAEAVEQACREQREVCSKKFRANAKVFEIHPKIIVNLMQMILSASREGE